MRKCMATAWFQRERGRNTMQTRLGRYVKVAIFLVTFGAMAVPGCNAADPHPIQWTLTAKAMNLPLRQGSVVQAILRAKILPGWHLYATEQQPGGPTATRINLSPSQPFRLDGAIESEMPPAITNDPNFNLETRYFEGDASFRIPIKATSRVSAAQEKLTVDVLFQTCNDRMCLPATVVHVSAQTQRGR
jgi:DsbC/DsbD-like thiol-disulfide interchange protein